MEGFDDFIDAEKRPSDSSGNDPKRVNASLDDTMDLNESGFGAAHHIVPTAIIEEGQVYPNQNSVLVLCLQICDQANRSYRQIRKEPQRLYLGCPDKTCSFLVRAVGKDRDGPVKITTAKLTHSCNGEIRRKKNYKSSEFELVERTGFTAKRQGPRPPKKPAYGYGLNLKKEWNLVNQLLPNMPSDYMYHIGISTEQPLKEMFGDVKFLIMGGSATRMSKFAKYIAPRIGHKLPTGQDLVDLSTTDRYSLYKVGPVLSASHGMGMPSISIILHELTKLLKYAGASDVGFIRIGTSGGLGVEPGTLILTDQAVNGEFRPEEEKIILGKKIIRPAHFDKRLCHEIMGAWTETTSLISAHTMSTHDFYEGQARLDGAICDYGEADKMDYLKIAHEKGVRNIEMESLAFAAFCYHLHIPAAMIAVTLLDRLDGDQVPEDPELLKEFGERPIRLVTAFIEKHLASKAKKRPTKKYKIRKTTAADAATTSDPGADPSTETTTDGTATTADNIIDVTQ